MKVLVTGGAGLIGSNLCKLLLEQGNEVICIDNFKPGVVQNIEGCLSNTNFKLLEYDISNCIPKVEVDLIYNLASPTAPGHFKESPIATIKANVMGTMNILELALIRKIPVVHISSIRTLEPSNTFTSSACYIESKRCSETICFEYLNNGVNVNVVRLFNVYGEGMRLDDSRVIPNFILKALKNETLDIFGGSQVDSFCYVTDIVLALIEISKMNLNTPINIGSGKFISINDLAKLIINITKSSSKLNIIENTEYANSFSRSTISINNLPYWKEKVTLEDGIMIMNNYYKNLVSESLKG